MAEPITITWALVGKEALLAAVRALVRNFTDALLNEVTKPQKSSSSSSAILQQTKEEAKWIEAQSEYLKRREEREKLALPFKHKELQLQQQDLEDRRELARLQRDLMRELHAETVKVKMTEIQTIWDSDHWFSKLSRQETEDIFRKGQQEYRLLVLASPPDISEDCPDSFRNNLKMEIQNRLRSFLEKNYPLSPKTGNFSSCPVEFYGDYFKEPISHIRVKKQLHQLLAPIPTLVLYSEISDYEVNFHLAYWGLYDDEISPVSMQAWNWEEVQEKLEEAGFDQKKSWRIIRQIIVMIHKLSAAFVADLYYLYIDATASYEPRLFDLEEEFDQELFPQELLRDYIEMLREVQQRQRELYEAELERLARDYKVQERQQEVDKAELKRLAKFPSWRFIFSFTGFGDDLYHLIGISADGSKLFGERSDGKTRKAWDLQSGKLMTAAELWQSGIGVTLTLERHSNYVTSVAFSISGQLLASASFDKTIKLWHSHTGELLRTLEGHSDYVRTVAFSPDGKLLASGSKDKTIKLWHLETGVLLRTIKREFWEKSEALLKEGVSLVSRVGPVGVIVPFLGEALRGGEDLNPVYSIAFSADGQLLVSGSSNKIQLWNSHTGELLGNLEGRGSIAVPFSSDRQLLAGSSPDNTIKLWHPQTGELLRTLEGHSDYVRTVAFSPDGKLLASGSNDNTIKLWHPQTGELLDILKGHSDNVRTVAFSPDGKLLASGSNDKTIKLWYPQTGELLLTLEGHSDYVGSVAFSPDGQLLASGSRDKTIKLWHPHLGNPLPANCEFPVTSPDRSLLVKPNYDQTTETWNLEIIDPATEQLLETLSGHSGSIEQVIFSEDGNTMVSLGGDLVIKVWRRGDG